MRPDTKKAAARAIRRPAPGPRFGVLVVPTAVGRDVPRPALLAAARHPLVRTGLVGVGRGTPEPSARRAATREEVRVPTTTEPSGEEVMGGALPAGEGPIDLASYFGWHLKWRHPKLTPQPFAARIRTLDTTRRCRLGSLRSVYRSYCGFGRYYLSPVRREHGTFHRFCYRHYCRSGYRHGYATGQTSCRGLLGRIRTPCTRFHSQTNPLYWLGTGGGCSRSLSW